MQDEFTHKTPVSRIILLIILIFVLMILAALGGYYFGINNPDISSTVTPTVTSSTTPTVTTTTDETADWKTYTNTTFNFTMKYPTDWNVKNNLQTILSKQSVVGQNLVIYKNNSQQVYPYLELYINTAGWGAPTSAIKYDIAYTNRKMDATNRQIISSDEMSSPVQGMISFWNGKGSNITLNNLVYYFAGYNATDRTDENMIVKMISTFQFTQ